MYFIEREFLRPRSPNLRVFEIVMKTFAQVSIALNFKLKLSRLVKQAVCFPWLSWNGPSSCLCILGVDMWNVNTVEIISGFTWLHILTLKVQKSPEVAVFI